MYALKWNDWYSCERSADGWTADLAEADRFDTISQVARYAAANARWGWKSIAVVKVEEQSQTTITLVDAGEV